MAPDPAELQDAKTSACEIVRSWEELKDIWSRHQGTGEYYLLVRGAPLCHNAPS